MLALKGLAASMPAQRQSKTSLDMFDRAGMQELVDITVCGAKHANAMHTTLSINLLAIVSSAAATCSSV